MIQENLKAPNIGKKIADFIYHTMANKQGTVPQSTIDLSTPMLQSEVTLLNFPAMN